MKNYKIIFPVGIAVALLSLSTAPVFACPWYDPLCATPTPTPMLTPTPTPTPAPKFIQLNPGLNKINPNLILLTATPTPTATLTPSATPTVTPTATVTVVASETSVATGSPMVTSTPQISVTPTPVPVKTAGFSRKELALAAAVVLLLLVIVVQANWAKIKTWLHQKTS